MFIKAIQKTFNTCFNCLKEIDDVHIIVIPQLGYGSCFDSFGTEIHLCSDCLKLTKEEWWDLEVIKDEYMEYYKYEDDILDFVRQMPIAGQELFFNHYARGANVWKMDAQDWIDYELGKLPHKKCKEYGLYSMDEINAYKEKFSTCEYVYNLKYEEEYGIYYNSWCPFDANGNENQEPDNYNISTECYNCQYYKKRETTIKTIDADKWFDKVKYIVLGKILAKE